jgi:hypothetical protein
MKMMQYLNLVYSILWNKIDMQMEENKLFVLRRKLLAIKITHWNDCID